MTNVIVVSTHRSGAEFLDNLLSSFDGYQKYPILVVMSDYKQSDEAVYGPLKEKHKDLPITWEGIETNSFEFGALYTAYHQTNFDEYFLLSHSCEVVNPDIFDIVFETHKGKSVVGSLQEADWQRTVRNYQDDKEFISRFLDKERNEQMVHLGKVKFWQGHIGKYRRAILDQMNLDDYLPLNMIEAASISELLFTSTYHSLDNSTIELFPDWKDGDLIVKKFGRKRLKIVNSYMIKWKTHWNVGMVLDDLRTDESA